MRTSGRALVGSFCVCAMTLFNGCSSGKPQAAALDAHEQMRRDYNAERFEVIYDGAAEEYHLSMSLTQSVDGWRRIRAIFGVAKQSEVVNALTQFGARGTYVTLRCRTAFERTLAEETTVWRVERGVARLVRYSASEVGGR
jgi:hypothetical protein